MGRGDGKASSDVPVPRPSRGVAIGHLPLRRGFDGAAVVASHPDQESQLTYPRARVMNLPEDRRGD